MADVWHAAIPTCTELVTVTCIHLSLLTARVLDLSQCHVEELSCNITIYCHLSRTLFTIVLVTVQVMFHPKTKLIESLMTFAQTGE